jgi:hypothetical protein
VRGNKSAYRCRWSANLRNATVVARGAVRKRPAVQIGQGQMCRLRSRDGLHFTKAGAGADRKRSSVTDLRCRPARGRVDPRANFRLAQRTETNLVCGPWVAKRSMPSSTGQANRPSSYGVISRAGTNAAATPIETFARYNQGSRLHPRTAQEGRH